MRRDWRQILRWFVTGRVRPGMVLTGAILGVCTVAAILDHRSRRVTRRIRMDFFRYGTRPCVIRARRGDKVVLQMRSLDTGHSFFLQEYDIDAKVTPGTNIVEVFHPSRPEVLPERKREVAFTAGRPGIWGWLCRKARFRCHVYCGPMHGFEHGDFVLWPNWLLLGALTVLLGLPLLGLCQVLFADGNGAGSPAENGVDESGLVPRATELFGPYPRLKTRFAGPRVRDGVAGLMTVGLYIVVLAGLLGTKMPGRNLAIMVVWIVWLFLVTIILVPMGGRFWCYLCPLPFFGDLLQRRARRTVKEGRRRFSGFGLEWPGILSGAWLRTILFLGMGTFSTFLATSPRATAGVLLGMLLAAFALAVVFELRTFCRFVCPINTFVGLYAMMGKLAVRPRDGAVCARCKVSTCFTGGEAGGGPCPYGLRLGDVDRNNDCGVCGECVLTCAYDNVGLWVRPFGADRKLHTLGEGWQAIVMLVLAVAYCVTHLGPWSECRNWVDLVDRRRWDLFWPYAMGLWGLALIAVPVLMAGAAGLGRRLAGERSSLRRLFLDDCGALVPLGLMVWVAFAVAPAMVDLTFVASALSDPFGWNWDLFGTANMAWRQVWPSGIPWVQTAAVLIGVRYALRNGFRNWLDATGGNFRRAVAGFLPAAALILVLATFLVVFFADSLAGL